MNQKRSLIKLWSILLILASYGCASYKATSLPTLHSDFATYSETIDGVTLSCKALSKEDCKKFFDRDIIGKGYQPIHLAIENDTEKHILFSTQNVSLPVCSTDEVAQKCHTNTAGRATAYGVAGLLIWPFLIPAVVDGVGSSNANSKLDTDFDAKTMEQVVVTPFSKHSGVIFVSTSNFQDSFTVGLVDRETKKQYEYKVKDLKNYHQ